ncbi:hypothetical protein EYF80_046641 [Liparis tanakae]|uniref:Uncharacterized protein n=1 Tax=Liparis tanakae TaxID=230148 RepID=A0A4Z2FQH2_9TELE|nr:hypothetical protein EYF80_046641 [Liparis tanakae]
MMSEPRAPPSIILSLPITRHDWGQSELPSSTSSTSTTSCPPPPAALLHLLHQLPISPSPRVLQRRTKKVEEDAQKSVWVIRGLKVDAGSLFQQGERKRDVTLSRSADDFLLMEFIK